MTDAMDQDVLPVILPPLLGPHGALPLPPLAPMDLIINHLDHRPAKDRVNDVLDRAENLTLLEFRGKRMPTYQELKLATAVLPELRTLRIDRAELAATLIRNGCPALESLLLYRCMGTVTMRWPDWTRLRAALGDTGLTQTLQELSISFNVPNAYEAGNVLIDIIDHFPSLHKLRIGLYLESHPGGRLPWQAVKNIIKRGIYRPLHNLTDLCITAFPLPHEAVETSVQFQNDIQFYLRTMCPFAEVGALDTPIAEQNYMMPDPPPPPPPPAPPAHMQIPFAQLVGWIPFGDFPPFGLAHRRARSFFKEGYHEPECWAWRTGIHKPKYARRERSQKRWKAAKKASQARKRPKTVFANDVAVYIKSKGGSSLRQLDARVYKRHRSYSEL